MEIEISTRLLDRVRIHAAMGVPELWRDDGSRVRMFRLGADRLYSSITRSMSFPALGPEDVDFLLELAKGQDEMSWSRAARAWIRATFGNR